MHYRSPDLADPNIGGICFPPLFMFLEARYGFPNGVRILAGISSSLALIACFLGLPSPGLKSHHLGPVLKLSTWIKVAAFKTLSYDLYCVSIWFTYSGYYPIAYHLINWAESKRFPQRFEKFWFLVMLNGCVCLLPSKGV